MNDENSRSDPAIRRLWNYDQTAISEHFLRLDAETRRSRFGGGVGNEFVKEYAQRILTIDAVVYGAFIEGKLHAVAELRGVLGSWPMTAEAALSVEPKWQDKGIGDALLTRIVAAAQNRGIKTLYMICLRENDRMWHLASKHHAVLELHTSEVEATLDPSWPTPFSIAEEFAGETRGFIHAVLYRPG